MADEAVCIEKPNKIVRYTIGGAIAKGTILKLSADPNTAAASAGADIFAGIAVEEVTAADYAAGVTQIAAALDGTWDIKCAGSGITLGGICSLSGANLIKQAVEAETVTGACFGKVLETASAAEVVRVRVGDY